MPIAVGTPEPNDPRLTESQILADYLPKLIRLAEKNLSNQLRQKVDAEEVGLSVMGSVIRQARQGKLQIEQSEDFWRLIVVIALNKVRKKSRHWKAQKRDMTREQPISPDGPQLADLAVDFRSLPDSPSAEEGQSLSDVLNQIEERLDDKCRQVLAAKLQNLTHKEIAEQINVSPRSIRRYMNKIESVVQQYLREQDN
jgi:RNA polymerase sigma factor (sigma-70 family)